jgi:predicted nucleic acid-binding protein
MYLVDTDVMIDIQRSYAPALTWFASVSELPSIPGFVVMELIQDAQNKQQLPPHNFTVSRYRLQLTPRTIPTWSRPLIDLFSRLTPKIKFKLRY